MDRGGGQALAGRRVLVAEDEYLIADDLVVVLEELGATVIGPAATLAAAQALVDAPEPIDAAILDINLRGEFVYPVLDTLLARGVPTVFATGYDAGVVPDAYAAIVRCEKPVTADAVMRVLGTALRQSDPPFER